LAEARAALDRGDSVTAKQYAEQAQRLAPESAYGPNETRPWMVLLEVNKAINNRGSVIPAGRFQAAQAVANRQNSGGDYPVAQGLYDPTSDMSRNVAAQSLNPNQQHAPGTEPPASPGEKLYQDGLRALESHDHETALKLFRDAWKYERTN
jgi:hypothetical protein